MAETEVEVDGADDEVEDEVDAAATEVADEVDEADLGATYSGRGGPHRIAELFL